MEKNKKISISVDHLYTKLKKEVTGEFILCSGRAYLPATMATAWTVNVSYTADFFEP